MPKVVLEEPFGAVFQKISGFEKVLWIRRWGGNHDFLSKLFCLKILRRFVLEPFCAVFLKVSGSEKVYG